MVSPILPGMLEILFGWTIVSIIVPLLVTGGLWGFMSMSPPEFEWAKICIFVGVLLLIAKTGVWLIYETDVVFSQRVTLAILVFGLSGTLWIESWRWIDARNAQFKTVPAVRDKETATQVLPQPALNTPLPPQSRFIRDAITNLIDELMLVSGKQHPEECDLFLQKDERWYPEDKRVNLFSLLHGKITVTKLLGRVHSALWGVEGGFLFSPVPAKLGGGRMVTPGYARVHDEYSAILSRPWVLTKTKYKMGTDPNPSPDFKTCAYGLLKLDGQFDRLKAALDDAEAAIRATPIPDLVPEFRIDWLDADLRDVQIPLDGLNVSEKTEQDANPAEYFPLKNGKYIRITKQKQVTYTEVQKQQIREVIRAHERTLQQQEPVLEAVRIAIARSGISVSSIRFTRAAVELRFDPQRFVSVDTVLGIIEVRSHTPFSTDQRKVIKDTIKDVFTKTFES